MWDYVILCEIIWDYVRLCEIMQDNMRIQEIMKDYANFLSLAWIEKFPTKFNKWWQNIKTKKTWCYALIDKKYLRKEYIQN